MNSIRRVLLVSLCFVFASTLSAQEWSEEQKEVWAFVEDYSNAYANGNYEKFAGVFHEDYKGWGYEAYVPMDRDIVMKYVKMSMENYEVIVSTRVPLSIQVYDDFAVVNYIFHAMRKDKSSEEVKEGEGRWTDILMKDNGKWYLVADHGGRSPN